MILFKQATGDQIDLSISEKFVNHYNDLASYAAYIIDNEVNSGQYDDPFFDTMLEGDPVVIDAGANVGLFALQILPKVRKLHCLEPTPSHFNILKDLVSRFDEEEKVKYHQVALNTFDGHCFWNEVETNSTENKIALGETSLKVTCKKLNSFMKENNLDEVDLLKMDIEGGEIILVDQDTELEEAFRKCKNIYLECHDHGTEPRIVGKIMGFGFSCTRAKRPSSYYFVNQNA